MDDPIEVALRRKKDSSMRVAVELVKEGGAHACVSAGNTGALMAVSRYVLKTMAGVDRPAICSILPNQKNEPTYMLDLGANVDCSPHHLHQFAIMGSVLFSAMEGVAKPTIGLLNVGTEEIKGNEVVKETAILLRADHERGILNFYGNVEGNDIFKGTTNVVVCDGFVGNVTLKAIEGLSRFMKIGLQAKRLVDAGRADRTRRPEETQSGALQRRRFARPEGPGLQEPWRRKRLRFRVGDQARFRRGEI